jgi:hypothetical protein
MFTPLRQAAYEGLDVRTLENFMNSCFKDSRAGLLSDVALIVKSQN